MATALEALKHFQAGLGLILGNASCDPQPAIAIQEGRAPKLTAYFICLTYLRGRLSNFVNVKMSECRDVKSYFSLRLHVCALQFSAHRLFQPADVHRLFQLTAAAPRYMLFYIHPIHRPSPIRVHRRFPPTAFRFQTLVGLLLDLCMAAVIAGTTLQSYRQAVGFSVN